MVPHNKILAVVVVTLFLSSSLTFAQKRSPSPPARGLCAKLLDITCEEFEANGGYSAYQSCQDAAQIFVDKCQKHGLPAQRVNFLCTKKGKDGVTDCPTGHAISVVFIDGKWCFQEPQWPGNPQGDSNIDLCFSSQPQLTKDLNQKLCEIYGWGQAYGFEILPTGVNPAGDLSDPKICSLPSQSGNPIKNLSQCENCCDQYWGATSPACLSEAESPIKDADKWVAECKSTCQTKFQNSRIIPNKTLITK